MLPKIQVASKAAPFHRTLLILLSPNVPAFCRLTISFNCGWRHFPGVRDSSEVGAGEDVALGVDGADREAIDVYEGVKVQTKRKRR